MESRPNYSTIALEPVNAMYRLGGNLSRCGIEASLQELIKMRVSQINGGAFCLDMHSKDARAAGETEQRLYALRHPAGNNLPAFGLDHDVSLGG